MKTAPRGKPIAELNLIPLIDVALILVIIFMVLTPILVQTQLTVKLPKASSGASADAAQTVTVQIARNGVVEVEGLPVRWDALERELALRLPRSARKTLLVQADRSVPVEKVVEVLDVARKLGVGRLGIGVAAGARP
ncbi:MAG: biopolymer transporter ExbD [Elusimicrobia bacterium]|nr:biopolymer transporter ExbD [Elusimicrobiota bacterium]MDE2236754.1 biopolymer transporter ExbD [Elusimicrobiota bacterium]MDE2425578.1 biopolymer transporter ExbD [Elusimicrobiota bacterium]